MIDNLSTPTILRDLGDGLILTTDDRGVFDAGFRRGQQTLILRGPGLIPKQIDVDVRDAALDVDVQLEPARGVSMSCGYFFRSSVKTWTWVSTMTMVSFRTQGVRILIMDAAEAVREEKNAMPRVALL